MTHSPIVTIFPVSRFAPLRSTCGLPNGRGQSDDFYSKEHKERPIVSRSLCSNQS